MSGWLRYLGLRAQLSTGFSSAIAIWALLAVVAAGVAIIFCLVAAFVWIADHSDSLTAALLLTGLFVLIAIISISAAAIMRRRNMERARLELAARNSQAAWLDPRLLGAALQIGQTIGWRRIASLAAVAVLAGLLS